MRRAIFAAVLFAGRLWSQNETQRPVRSFDDLKFLEGTWEAKTQGGGAGAAASGTYAFRKELGGHILARHSSADGCKGPSDFDCDHNDLLYVFQDAPGQPLKAIYFDNEGHAIHYDVLAASATEAVFLSDSSVPGPRFRLVYALREGVMSGRFQIQLPGQAEWKSYLEWSGRRK
jgi:hypothetical protein